MIKKSYLVFLLLPLLVSCQEKQNYSYYMQHPLELKKIIMACENNDNPSTKEAAQCDIANSAATDLLALIRDQQSHPEAFGQRVIDEQINYAKQKQAVVSAEENLAALKAASDYNQTIRNAQDDLYKSKKECREKLEQIKVLLAVLGMSSPG